MKRMRKRGWEETEEEINEENEKEEEIKSNLSASLFSPPKATTVLMADRTSSATDPAAAYALCSLAVNDATIWRQDSTKQLLFTQIPPKPKIYYKVM
jgi:hypothetical protein